MHEDFVDCICLFLIAIMGKQNFKTKKILVITLICVIFVSALVTGFILFNKKDNNQESLFDNEQTPETTVQQEDDNVIIENTVQDDLPEDIEKEEYYSVIFLDSNGDTLQSKLFKKGSTPYYAGKSLSSNSRKFNTWIPSISTVSGNQAYIATYFYPESSVSSNNNSSSGSGSTPSSSNTYASIIYKDIDGNQQSLILESGTTINFSAGEHGIYNTVPSSVTLTDNQQLDITNSSYNPSQVEVNYIFKGFSYSGNTMKCEYSLTNNFVNVECKQVENAINRKNVFYTQLEYLEGTGTQYINTGVKREENSKYEFEFQFNSLSSITYTNIWGCDERERTTQAYDKLYLYTRNDDSKIRFGDKSSYEKIKTSISTGTRYHVEIKNGEINFNGTVTSGIQWTKANNNDCIFWTRINDPIYQDCLNGRFYYYKTWKGSELKLDLVPAKRLTDNVPGMLDLVNGDFLTNSGSGVFKLPDTISIPGINAGKVMATGSYETGPIALTAVPNDGYTFVGWTDGSTNQTRSISIGDNAVYIALFELN